MFHPSCIELSGAALRNNIRFLKRVTGRGVRFCSVIKANAYGHGVEAFVPLAERCGVRQFAVFSADEAERTVAARTRDSDIMIMGAMDPASVEWAVEHGIQFWVFDPPRAELAIRAAKKAHRPACVHLEIETGLHRTGLDQRGLASVVETFRNNSEHVVVEGTCTHLAGADSVSNYLRIMKQLHTFRERCSWIQSEGLSTGVLHTACSAAAFAYPMSIFGMVRFGIAQYGFWPSRETHMHYVLGQEGPSEKKPTDPLRRVMRWRSTVMSITEVPAGEFVGYGTSYLTNRRQRFASVPVGYSHGFARSLSNLGQVLIRGHRIAIAGMVNMNMMMVDVTDVPEVEPGDEVVLIGKQKRLSITVASFSEMTRYLNYEVLVRLPADIPRIVV